MSCQAFAKVCTVIVNYVVSFCRHPQLETISDLTWKRGPFSQLHPAYKHITRFLSHLRHHAFLGGGFKVFFKFAPQKYGRKIACLIVFSWLKSIAIGSYS